MQVFGNNNARFCYRSKEKVLSLNTFGRMQIWIRKNKMENLINDDLEKSESDSDSIDGTESDNYESNE